MMSLIGYGTLIEYFHGHQSFMIVHTLSAVGGGLMAGNIATINLIGASGAIYGLLGSKMGDVLQAPRENWFFAIGIVTVTVIDTLLSPPNISFSDHIGGALTGICAGIILFDTSGHRAQVLASIVLVLGFLGGIAGIICRHYINGYPRGTEET